MGNEHIPNRDIDQYLNPPLHPDYDTDKISAKLSARRAAMRKSVEISRSLQAQQSVKRAADKKRGEEARAAASKNSNYLKPRLTYKDNPSGYGWLTKGVEQPRLAQHSAETDHFFLYNEQTKGFELIYHGSADIVSFLEMHQAVDAIVCSKIKPPLEGRRSLAFFDNEARFYGNVLLEGLYPNVHFNGASPVKHTAVFEPIGENHESFAIPIDDMHCLSLAKPPLDIRPEIETT